MSHHPTHAEHYEHHDKPHHEKQHATHHEEAARAPVAPLDADASEHASRPAPQKPEGEVASMVPPEKPVVNPPVQTIVPPATNDLAPLQPVSEELRLQAETKLAEFIGSKMVGDKPEIAADFAKGLKLTVKENINGQHDGLELCFKGDSLTAGSGLFGEQIIAVLKQHPSFTPLFADEKTRPHFMKPREEGKEDMLHVHVNNLSAEQFIALVNSIATAVPMPKPQHEEVVQKATGTEIAAKKEHVNDNPLPVVQGPVAALDREKGIANDNEISNSGVAL